VTTKRPRFEVARRRRCGRPSAGGNQPRGLSRLRALDSTPHSFSALPLRPLVGRGPRAIPEPEEPSSPVAAPGAALTNHSAAWKPALAPARGLAPGGLCSAAARGAPIPRCPRLGSGTSLPPPAAGKRRARRLAPGAASEPRITAASPARALGGRPLGAAGVAFWTWSWLFSASSWFRAADEPPPPTPGRGPGHGPPARPQGGLGSWSLATPQPGVRTGMRTAAGGRRRWGQRCVWLSGPVPGLALLAFDTLQKVVTAGRPLPA
jgi:hypothetical protein